MDEATNFWRHQLAGVEDPLVHFVPSDCLQADALRRAARALGFAFFSLDASRIQSESRLLDAFSSVMSFPTYYGHNWDSVLDLTRDFSWNKREGYVLLLSNADFLLSLGSRTFSILVGVLEATIREWRDERGEYGGRTKAIPFHAVFSGTDQLRAALLQKVKEPLCDHESALCVRAIRAPGAIRGTECFRDAEKLIQSGADLELVLSFLRERGLAEVDSTYVLAGLTDKTIPEAKALVDGSQTWSGRYSTDARLRDAARSALRELGFL